MEIKISLPDSSIRKVERGTTVGVALGLIRPGIGKKAAAAWLNGELVDLSTPLAADSELEIVESDSPDGLEIYRRSAAILLAQAVTRLYGEQAVKLGEIRTSADGFYAEFDLGRSLSESDLEAVEAEMRRIAEANLPVVRQSVNRAEAEEWLAGQGEVLRLEVLPDMAENAKLGLYRQGEFAALAEGPLVPRTGLLRAFRLLGVAGAYWRGDPERQMLQRIYGTAFPSGAELAEHLRRLDEAKARDHRRLGRELELFQFSEEAPGMPFYLPNGMVLRNELQALSRRLMRRSGYREVMTPLLMNNRLWEMSGHYDHYKEHMYFTQVDDTPYALKPMNCPGHMLIFKSRLRSYRELPIRLAEFGQVHRHEFSGSLGGMTRVRSFCQDDAHLFVTPEQIEDEIGRIIALIGETYALFGLDYRVELSTRPRDSMGSPELWDRAEQGLRGALERMKPDYRINAGDGAFYGPKIDFHLRDSLGRSWQCGTIQLDFQMPEKFDLSYIGEDGRKHRPVVIHRAVYGALDRFIGVLTEHYGGAFPLWLSPVQVAVLPVSPASIEYARTVYERLEQEGIRAELDDRPEKLGHRLREARLRQTPYTFIVGDKEQERCTVSARRRGGDSQEEIPLEEALKLIVGKVREMRE